MKEVVRGYLWLTFVGPGVFGNRFWGRPTVRRTVNANKITVFQVELGLG